MKFSETVSNDFNLYTNVGLKLHHATVFMVTVDA